MPSAYTDRGRFTLQATGENSNVWGVILNQGVFGLVDFALDGVVTISATGATILTTANGAPDQARGRVLNYTGATPGTLTIPSVEKQYWVRAATADVTVTNGASSITVRAGDIASVITDGATIWGARQTDFGGLRLKSVGTPTQPADAVTKSYADAIAAAAKAYTDATAFATQAGTYPGLAGNRTRFMRVNPGATAAEWEPSEITVTANYTAGFGDRIVANTSGGAFTVTLPASPAEGDWVAIRDGGNSTSNGGWVSNNVTINPNGATIRGNPDATLALNIKGAALTFRYTSGQWSVALG